MNFHDLTFYEKIMAALIDDIEFRKENLEDIQTLGFKDEKLADLLSQLDMEDGIANILNKDLAIYAMELANAHARNEIERGTRLPDATDPEKIEQIRDSLSHEQKRNSYNAIFTRAAVALLEWTEGKIKKAEFAEAYNDWQQYLEMKK